MSHYACIACNGYLCDMCQQRRYAARVQANVWHPNWDEMEKLLEAKGYRFEYQGGGGYGWEDPSGKELPEFYGKGEDLFWHVYQNDSRFVNRRTIKPTTTAEHRKTRIEA